MTLIQLWVLSIITAFILGYLFSQLLDSWQEKRLEEFKKTIKQPRLDFINQKEKG